MYRFIPIRIVFTLLCVFLCLIVLFCTKCFENKYKRVEKWQFQSKSSEYSIKERLRIKNAKKCFQPKNEMIYTDLQMLPDVLASKTRPKPNKAIFFHETSCIQNGIVHLNARYYYNFAHRPSSLSFGECK